VPGSCARLVGRLDQEVKVSVRRKTGHRLVVMLMSAVLVAGMAAVTTVTPAAAGDLLENGSFEIPGTTIDDCNSGAGGPAGGESPNAGSFELIDATNTGKAIGWSTTDDCLERWSDGFLGIDAYEGTYMAELNATCAGALYQEFAVTPGQLVVWKVAHAGRSGSDTMRFYLGDSTSAATSARCSPQRRAEVLAGLTAQIPLYRNGVKLNRDPSSPTAADLTDTTNDWGLYFGIYTVPAGVTQLRFAMSAVDDGSTGNLVDAAAVELPEGSLTVRKIALAPEVAPVVGAPVDYQIQVSAEGSVYGPIEVEDTRADELDCPDDLDEVGDGDMMLEGGETMICTATVYLTKEEIRRGRVRNTATATGDFGLTTATGKAVVKVAPTIAVLLDESGSIGSDEGIWIGRYNRVLKDFKRLTTAAPYSLTLFNSKTFERRYVDTPIASVPKLTRPQFDPDHLTNLYDSATKAIEQLAARKPVGRVIFVIATDGADNASVRASQSSLASLIRAKERRGWNFIYVGAGAADLQAAVAALVTEAPAAR